MLYWRLNPQPCARRCSDHNVEMYEAKLLERCRCLCGECFMVARLITSILLTVPATSYKPVAFMQCLTLTASTSENAIFRIDNKSAAEFKAASDIRFDICDDPPTTAFASASLKIIWYGAPVSLLVHCCRHPYPVLRQNIRPRKGYEEGTGELG
jgi:hypothetical protein